MPSRWSFGVGGCILPLCSCVQDRLIAGVEIPGRSAVVGKKKRLTETTQLRCKMHKVCS
jgi:hypothetical protein